MPQNPYLNLLITAAGALVFIALTSYGMGTLARLIARYRGATPKIQENTFAGYLFAAPWITGFLIFVVVPLGFSLYWSFTDYRIGVNQAPNLIGFENYRNLMK